MNRGCCSRGYVDTLAMAVEGKMGVAIAAETTISVVVAGAVAVVHS